MRTTTATDSKQLLFSCQQVLLHSAHNSIHRFHFLSPAIRTSIVAILILEVTGIPELSEYREFPWPKPSFVNPTSSHLFEVSYGQ